MIKTYVSMFLSLVISCSFIFSSTAMALTPMEETGGGNFDRDLVTIAYELQERRTQTYSTESNTYMEILANTDEYQEVKFVEGNKVDIISYDLLTGEVYVDGQKIMVEDVVVSQGISPMALGNAFDIVYKNISLQKQLIQYTTDGLCSVLELVGEFTGNVAWSLASSLVSMCASAGYAYSNACYAKMYKRLDSSYTYYVKYWDMYWNSSYTDFCDRYTQTIYQ